MRLARIREVWNDWIFSVVVLLHIPLCTTLLDRAEDQHYEYDGLLEVLSELSSICGGGVFVRISNHPEFHQSTGNLMLTATKVMEVCASAGVVVTDNDLAWKQVSGLTDCNYSCAGDSKLFYVLQKKLIVEMIMDVLSLDAQTVSDLKAFGKEDGDDMRSKWYYFEDVAELLSAQCHAEGAQSTADHQCNADTCVNCHANGQILC